MITSCHSITVILLAFLINWWPFSRCVIAEVILSQLSPNQSNTSGGMWKIARASEFRYRAVSTLAMQHPRRVGMLHATYYTNFGAWCMVHGHALDANGYSYSYQSPHRVEMSHASAEPLLDIDAFDLSTRVWSVENVEYQYKQGAGT